MSTYRQRWDIFFEPDYDDAVAVFTRGIVVYDYLLLGRPIGHVGIAEGSGKDVMVDSVSVVVILQGDLVYAEDGL